MINTKVELLREAAYKAGISSDSFYKMLYQLGELQKMEQQPQLPQADVVRQSEPLPPSNCYDPICSSCKQPMDEDEGRWGLCNDCYTET